MFQRSVRTLFAVGALAALSGPARATETAAEKEGMHMVDVGQTEQRAALADEAQADELERKAKDLAQAADKNDDKAAESQASHLHKKARAMRKAAKARREAAEEMMEDGREIARAGAQQKAAEENARALPDR